MNTSVEISYYPLQQEYISPILDFIGRLNKYESLTVQTNGMSTQIFGEYTEVMNALTSEIRQSFEIPHSVFVLKIINANLNNTQKGIDS